MSFAYDFDIANDKVRFAYCIPYTYSDLLKMIREVSASPCLKFQTGWRSLSGLPIPLLQVTDFDEPSYNKKIVLVTARIHPGQSNSSHVCEGLIRAICSDENRFKQVRKRYHFFIVPMLNPDGVVAGNYRTSLFGKDLNRTFNQSRKYAFPEIFHLLDYTKKLKKEHKQRFSIYLDLHGHSVKKNVFFYGPDYNIAHNFYSQSRDYAKILGNLTPMFRYYSCIFRISNEKSTTARATLNRVVDIPFTYTLESSNGAFYDSLDHSEKPFTVQYWVEMGAIVAKGLGIWLESQKKPTIQKKKQVKKYVVNSDSDEQNEPPKTEKELLLQVQPPGKQKVSDDEISEGKSDSQPEEEDLSDELLRQLEHEIKGLQNQDRQDKKQKIDQRDAVSRLYPPSPDKSERGTRGNVPSFDWSQNLRSCKNQASRKSNPSQVNENIFQSRKQKLPPINLQLNPHQFFGNKSKKKKVSISEAFSNLTAVEIRPPVEERRINRISISQMKMQMKGSVEDRINIHKKHSRQEIALRILK